MSAFISVQLCAAELLGAQWGHSGKRSYPPHAVQWGNNQLLLLSAHTERIFWWSRVCCWLELLACLLSLDSDRVTGQLKPLIYYSSTHVRYYRGTAWCSGVGWVGWGVPCTTASQGQEVDNTNMLASEQAGNQVTNYVYSSTALKVWGNGISILGDLLLLLLLLLLHKSVN